MISPTSTGPWKWGIAIQPCWVLLFQAIVNYQNDILGQKLPKRPSAIPPNLVNSNSKLKSGKPSCLPCLTMAAETNSTTSSQLD